MSNTMNRRSAMIGLAALSSAPAAAAFSTVAKAAPNLDAALIATCVKWQADEKKVCEMFDIAGRLSGAEYTRAEAAANRMGGKQWKRLVAICHIPPFTIAGLNAKVGVLVEADVFDGSGGETIGDIGGTLLADIVRLAIPG